MVVVVLAFTIVAILVLRCLRPSFPADTQLDGSRGNLFMDRLQRFIPEGIFGRRNS
jgi:hypothetical protein